MAYVGVAMPCMASRDNATGKFSDFTQFAKAVGVNITPTSAEGSLHADNIQSEHDTKFSYATVEFETDTAPAKVSQMAYGHTVTPGTDGDIEFGEEISSGSDVAPFTGAGFHGEEVINGVHTYIGYVLPKVQWNEGEDSFQTAGENITFSTRKMSGKAFVDENGHWRYRQRFKTEAEAIAFVEKKLNKEGK